MKDLLLEMQAVLESLNRWRDVDSEDDDNVDSEDDDNVYCFCDIAIGNPAVKDHSEVCKRAQALYRKLKRILRQ